MPSVTKPHVAGALCIVCLAYTVSRAQSLAPRAYVITPDRANVVTLTFSFYNGNILFNGAVSITGATARVSVPILTDYHLSYDEPSVLGFP